MADILQTAFPDVYLTDKKLKCSKLSITEPMCGESSSDWWIPLTKGL